MTARGPAAVRDPEEDSARWLEFEPRSGDIVISSRSKHGTTWLQMICALLVLRTPNLPAPLARLSPWLDWLVRPLPDVLADLERQEHRRFIKTHTPLDGLPIYPDVGYLVVARHPLDAAISLYHQGRNIDRERLAMLTGDIGMASTGVPTLESWIADWVHEKRGPDERLDAPPGVFWHLGDAWMRRHEPNVVLVHYHDLERDLIGGMRRLAAALSIEIDPSEISRLANAATFDAMRDRLEHVPDVHGVLKDRSRFFRRGSSGAAVDTLGPDIIAAYHARAERLAPPDLREWLHRP